MPIGTCKSTAALQNLRAEHPGPKYYRACAQFTLNYTMVPTAEHKRPDQPKRADE
jgi:hypothetical protein